MRPGSGHVATAEERSAIRRPMRAPAPVQKDGPRVNEEIRVREVQLIDQTGHNHGPVEIKAHVEGGMIVVEVTQQKPRTSSAVLFERAKALVETRLRHDFANGVSETSTADGWLSFIRSEDAWRPNP